MEENHSEKYDHVAEEIAQWFFDVLQRRVHSNESLTEKSESSAKKNP